MHFSPISWYCIIDFCNMRQISPERVTHTHVNYKLPVLQSLVSIHKKMCEYRLEPRVATRESCWADLDYQRKVVQRLRLWWTIFSRAGPKHSFWFEHSKCLYKHLQWRTQFIYFIAYIIIYFLKKNHITLRLNIEPDISSNFAQCLSVFGSPFRKYGFL